MKKSFAAAASAVMFAVSSMSAMAAPMTPMHPMGSDRFDSDHASTVIVGYCKLHMRDPQCHDWMGPRHPHWSEAQYHDWYWAHRHAVGIDPADAIAFGVTAAVTGAFLHGITHMH